MKKPLMFDLCCGLGGATEGFLAEGWHCIGVDIERHQYGNHRYPAQLWIQDICTIDGAQLKDAAFLWASVPCQFFSYTSMPWSTAKALAAAVRADPERLAKELALFNACFRIQREACEAAGRHIPMVVENVKGAQPWVGRARWNYGSFYLYGDVPALMPITLKASRHRNQDGHIKQGGDWFAEARKGGEGGTSASFGSKSPQRKMASAMIAKIPEPLSRHIAKTFHPGVEI